MPLPLPTEHATPSGTVSATGAPWLTPRQSSPVRRGGLIGQNGLVRDGDGATTPRLLSAHCGRSPVDVCAMLCCVCIMLFVLWVRARWEVSER